jgi:uncharacterized membrane protein
MPLYVRAFLIGMIVGLGSLTAPAVVSRAAHLGGLLLENTGLRFLGTPHVLSVLTIVEPVADRLAKTPAASARQVCRPAPGGRVVWRGLPPRRSNC